MVNKLFRHRTRKHRPKRARTRKHRRKRDRRRYRGGMDTPSPTADFDPTEFDELELEEPGTKVFDDFAIRQRWYDRLPSSLQKLPEAKPGPPTGQRKAARGTKRPRKPSTCATPNCRRPIGHPGEHSALAERLLAMSPQARKQYYQQVNDPRRKERKRADRSTSCNTPHCQKARNHPPPCTQKAKFVRCREKYCRKPANHDGKHSGSTGTAKAIQKMLDSKAAASSLGRDVAVQADLAITGNAPSR